MKSRVMYFYEFEHWLDCGDLGKIEVTVYGSIGPVGVFTDSFEKKILSVAVRGVLVGNARTLLTRAALVDLEEELERQYERDQHPAVTGEDVEYRV